MRFPKIVSILGAAALGIGVLSAGASDVKAADKVTFMTSWFAQAEHGGFYQAKAAGIYKKYNLDVTIKMGGPQVNGMQLLGAGKTDFLMSYDFSVLKAIQAGIPAVTVGTSFQFDLQGLVTHPDVKSLAGLKGKKILVATAGRSNWWPWMKAKYGYKESQTKPYTFNLQPFLADKNATQQGYLSSEPFAAKSKGHKVNFFLFAKDGYPPYGTTIVTTQNLVKDKPDVVARFVRASIEGWKSYMKNPGPGNALIKKDNKNMTDAQIAFAISSLKANKLLDGGDAATMGMGVITEARWKKTYDFMVKAGLLKASVDYKKAFTTKFVKDLKIMP
jgi:NitT/TauT family transport system substrate-binding protein